MAVQDGNTLNPRSSSSARPETQGTRPDRGRSPERLAPIPEGTQHSVSGGQSAAPSPPMPAPTRGPSRIPFFPRRPSPPLTLQQPLDDAVDVQLVYIRHRLSAAGRTPLRRFPPSAGCSAGPAPLLLSARRAFPVPSTPALSLSSLSLSPRPPLRRRSQLSPSAEQNGRRLLSELGGGWIPRARGRTRALL